MAKKGKSKSLLYIGIGFASIVVNGIIIALIINIGSRGLCNAPGLNPQDLAAKLADLMDAASEATHQPNLNAQEPAQPSSESDLPTPEHEIDIEYGPYIFAEANKVQASKLLAYYGLNEKEMRLYEELLAGFISLETIIRLEMSLNTEEDYALFDKVYEILIAVHPEIFWLSLNCTVGHYADGTTFVRPLYLIDSYIFCAVEDGRTFNRPTDSEIAAAKSWIEKQQSNLVNILDMLPVHSGMTTFELEVAVHDWLCVYITFDDNAPNKNTLYGALVEKTAACEGYSRAFQHIMGLMGIESLMIYGTHDSINHAWNAAKLGGKWYQVDMTLNATIMTGHDFPNHLYLNRSDEYMIYDHLWHDGAAVRENPLIVCTATEYNYFVMTGQRPIASDEDFMHLVPDYIARARAEGILMFEMEFDRTYAMSDEIVEKKTLIDASLWEDVVFYWFDRLIIGVFS